MGIRPQLTGKTLAGTVYAHIINHFCACMIIKPHNAWTILLPIPKKQRRITKFYQRESTVIYPPVEIKAATKGLPFVAKRALLFNLPPNYFLSVSRLARAKHTI